MVDKIAAGAAGGRGAAGVLTSGEHVSLTIQPNRNLCARRASD
jgi:hypothetical protein